MGSVAIPEHNFLFLGAPELAILCPEGTLACLETEYRLFPPVTIFFNLFPRAGYFFNTFD